jgi:hypothetical protein
VRRGGSRLGTSGAAALQQGILVFGPCRKVLTTLLGFEEKSCG